MQKLMMVKTTKNTSIQLGAVFTFFTFPGVEGIVATRIAPGRGEV
jgi:hypothetical protein